jgi:hypothetical protein
MLPLVADEAAPVAELPSIPDLELPAPKASPPSERPGSLAQVAEGASQMRATGPEVPSGPSGPSVEPSGAAPPPWSPAERAIVAAQTFGAPTISYAPTPTPERAQSDAAYVSPYATPAPDPHLPEGLPPSFSAEGDVGLRAGVRGLASSRGAGDDAPLSDPFLKPRPYDGPARLSPLALASVLVVAVVAPLGAVSAFVFEWTDRVPLVVGGSACVGAFASVVLGALGRREIEQNPQRRSGFYLATAGMVLGLVLGVVSGVVLGVGHALDAFEDDKKKTAKEEPAEAAPVLPGDRPPASPLPHLPPPKTPSTSPPPAGNVPKTTRVSREGAITVVDVGYDSRSLTDEISKQRAEAQAAGETLVVMVTTEVSCDPCRKIAASLKDDKVQKALAKVRLCRIDSEVFREDLKQLRMFPGGLAWFFLVAPDLSPSDGISSGEWDEDVPENIAPVLGPFVRGSLGKRRQPWRLPPKPSGGGVRL